MKYKNIFNLIIEGPDGVGKSTLISNLFNHYNFRYMCYHRGELSNFVFAKKYNRPFFATQRGLPFLYIYLTCSEADLQARIHGRYTNDIATELFEEESCELEKVYDVRLFDQAAKEFENDYDIVTFDTTGKNADQVFKEVVEYLDQRFENEQEDEKETTWNAQYRKACKELGLSFKVIDNQPYIEGIPFNVESTLHNGVCETFSDKRPYPDNLIYAYGYSRCPQKEEKVYDFNYIINSKIKRRKEIYDYYDAFVSAGKTCLISSYDGIKDANGLIRTERAFGDDFIKLMAKSKATVYSARDLAYLNLQTARLYEAILADNVLFVDLQSDKEQAMLKRIHVHKDIVDLLTVTPESICKRYDEVFSDENLKNYILESQKLFLKREFSTLETRCEKV